MKTCKVENCNNPIWSKGLCSLHSPHKAMKRQRTSEKTSYVEMGNFFLSIWNKRPHVSELSNTPLGTEPLSIFFHHILPKKKYEEATFDEENVILLTLDEHTNVESNPQRYELINEKREYLKIKYNL